MKKSDIHDLKDLKGKRIAVPALGTALDMALRVMLETVGYEANRDYTPVEVRFPNMYAMLSQGKVDCAIVIPPWWYMEKIQKELAHRDLPTKVVRLDYYYHDLDGTRKIIQKILSMWAFTKEMEKVEGGPVAMDSDEMDAGWGGE